MEQNYAEIFCEAVGILAKDLINKVSYDKTILCTIIDDSEKDAGKYRVSNLESKFDAYSTNTTYKKDDEVYVSIPGGDWSEQKLIVSKKINNQTDIISIIDPYKSFINITNNIVDEKHFEDGIDSKNIGLTANHKDISVINLWKWKDEDNAYIGYSRLAVSASFKTWLRASNVWSGSYGLIVKIGRNENELKSCILSCEDMIGNPYRFDSFFPQTKIFDLKDMNDISYISIDFFQLKDFKDKNGQLISSELSSTTGESQYLPPNIFVSDINISFGYDANEFEKDALILYTSSPIKYGKNEEDNNKTVEARWIHKFDNDFKVITNNNLKACTLTFYRYELGHTSDTLWSGVDWKPLMWWKCEKTGETYTVSFKKSEDDKWSESTTSELLFNTNLSPDVDKAQEEKIKAVLTYNPEENNEIAVISNILTFSNNDKVVDTTTLKAIRTLSIYCTDESNGNYPLYKKNGKILNSSYSSQNREFKLRLDGGELDNQDEDIKEIIWTIPKNSMINIISPSSNFPDLVEGDNGNYKIEWSSDSQKECPLSLNYTIKNNIYDNNSVISCKVIKNDITYIATKELTFTRAGTSGTDYTFMLDFEGNSNALNTFEMNKVTTIKASLYDYTGKIIDISKKEINWSFLNENSEDYFEIVNSNENSNDEKCKYKSIQWKKGVTASNYLKKNYAVLKASLKGWGDYELLSYLPIPINNDSTYISIGGVTTIEYNSFGQLDADSYDKDPQYLIKTDGSEYYGEWEIFSPNDKTEGKDKYAPTIKSFALKETDTEGNLIDSSDFRYYIVPLNFYVENGTSIICAVGYGENNKILWSQPIFITQDKYPSSLVNKWDGQLKIDNDRNAILAAQVVAGKKNSDNTFSGVMMGDWEESDSEDSISKHTGIYGFQGGVQSFGFRDDGTAFIGKPGAGRLKFDGNKSTITSNLFEAGKGGMQLDFDDGLIEMRNPIRVYWTGDFVTTKGWPKEIKTTREVYQKVQNMGAKVIAQEDATETQKDQLSKAELLVEPVEEEAADQKREYYLKVVCEGTVPTITLPVKIVTSEKSSSITIDVSENTTPFTIGKNFSVDWDGTLKATNGEFTGKIEADEGEIGGWTIDEGILYSGSVGISSKYNINGEETDYAFWAGDEDPGSADFSVKRDGTVTMKNGLIQCGINIGDGAFTVDAKSGAAKITSGEIKWDIITGTGKEALESGVENNNNAIIQLSADVSGLTTRVSDSEGNITLLQQTSSSLTSTVGNLESGYNTITQTLDKGVVFESDLIEGNTTINGSCITTGKIDANYICLRDTMSLYQLKGDILNQVGTLSMYTGRADDYTTYGVDIKAQPRAGSNYCGQFSCSDSGVWIGYGKDSPTKECGIAAYENAMQIKAKKLIFNVGEIQGLSNSLTATAVFG